MGECSLENPQKISTNGTGLHNRSPLFDAFDKILLHFKKFSSKICYYLPEH